MSISPLAGTLPKPQDLVDIPFLISAYYTGTPSAEVEGERVSFGTSGHRGSSLRQCFTDTHIAAITQAVCEYRKTAGIHGPLFMGKDTHALSEPAWRTALEVLVANDVTVLAQKEGFTPTPSVSHAILSYNRQGKALSDGIIITPSHNPPADGGFKYNPPHGGPADTDITSIIQKRANELMANSNRGVKRTTFAKGLASSLVMEYDFMSHYIDDLSKVIDFNAIVSAKLKLGVNPLGGASLDYWIPIAEKYGLDLENTNNVYDPTFRFMPYDHDGKIRMDCSSPWAMAELLKLKDKFNIAFACDPDSDRHGIVTPEGLMNPNHYLSTVVDYLIQDKSGFRKSWKKDAMIGKTVVTSSMLNRVAEHYGRKVQEVPVGFKWFVQGLHNGTCCLGCEESAGASFLQADGLPWSTDKDGLILCLLAAEMTAVTGKNPAERYHELEAKFGAPVYKRVDSPMTPEVKKALSGFTPESLNLKEVSGSPVKSIITKAPGNNASFGGLKVITDNGWFAVRPSGTEPIYKLYLEDFRDSEHLEQMKEEAQTLLSDLAAQ